MKFFLATVNFVINKQRSWLKLFVQAMTPNIFVLYVFKLEMSFLVRPGSYSNVIFERNFSSFSCFHFISAASFCCLTDNTVIDSRL